MAKQLEIIGYRIIIDTGQDWVLKVMDFRMDESPYLPLNLCKKDAEDYARDLVVEEGKLQIIPILES